MSQDRPDPDELRDLCRQLLADRKPLALLDDPAGRRALWDELTALGWAATLLPESAGGMGWSWREAAIIAREIGRALVPVPFLSTALVAPAGLAALPTDAASDLMTSMAGGERCVAVAGLPSSRLPGDELHLTVGSALEGRCWFVLDAVAADSFLVAADDDSGAVLASVSVDAATVEPHELVDATRTAAQVTFAGVPATVLARGDDARLAIDAMEAALRIGVACDALGGAEVVVDLAVAYAKERVQFGRPIGSFQAVKHRLADLYVLLQGASAIVETAVDALADEASASGAADSLAYASATDAYARIAGDAVLVHGAIGFTWEHVLHRYLKRALLDQHLAGSTIEQRDRHLRARLATIGATA